MELKIKSLDRDIIEEFKRIINQSKEGDNLLSISELKLYNYTINLFLIFLFGFLLLIFLLDRTNIYWIYGGALIFSFFFAELLYLLTYYFKVNKAFLYYDKNIVLLKDLDTIHFYPLNQLTEVNFTGHDDKKLVNIQLRFGEKGFYFTYNRSRSAELKNFAKTIVNSGNTIKNGGEIEFSASRKLYKLLNVNHLNSNEKPKKRFVLITIILSSLTIYTLLPYFFDLNSYRISSEINTPSSYREYLDDVNNSLFREAAKTNIEKLYDEAIVKYKNKSTVDNEAIVDLLEYLKENEVYVVDITFENRNEIKDIHKNKNINIRSAEYSFTESKNRGRESKLLLTLNSILGEYFPVDIVSIADINDADFTPMIVIKYTYSNSDDGSIYYPTEQKNLPKARRDYFYGITINWKFDLYLSSNEQSIYNFTLKSNPAVQFTSESNSSDNVYSNMIYSAFKDLEVTFREHFFEEHTDER